MELRICTKCEIVHAENCPKCFGFGLYRLSDAHEVPVSAAQAHGDVGMHATVYACPICGGGIANKGAARAS